MGEYRFIEEVALADCALEIDGATLDDLFATAARALAAVMVDPDTIAPTIERRISLEAEARDLLLFDWLAELILRKDRDREVFSRANVSVRGDGPCHLDAVVSGAPIDAERMELRNDPKAVTLHGFALERTAAGWRARVVIDI